MTYLMVVALALFLSLLVTPLAKLLADRLKILDKPGQRKIHQEPMPLTGGIAVFLAFSLSLLLLGHYTLEVLGIIAVGLLFILFGLLDDAGIKMRARYKIFVHLFFSVVFVWLTGLHFAFFRNELINLGLTIGFITFMTNSMNMLDGMDGLDSGVACLASLFFAILSINSGQADLLIIALALMGATLGFLRYNFNPASIFLGEAGSTFLGFLLALMAIKIHIFGLWDVSLALRLERLQFISFIVPLIILGIPIFDTYFVFFNRFLHRIKFSQPGKDHSHHRIHLMGFSQRLTVLTLYGVQVVLGAIALAIVRADVQQFFALLSIVGVFFVGFTLFLSRVDVYS